MEERTTELVETVPETETTEETTELPLEEETSAEELSETGETETDSAEDELVLDVPEEEPAPAEPKEEPKEEKPAQTPEETQWENRVREVGAKALRESMADFARNHPELSPALIAEVEAIAAGERRRADVEFAARRDWAAKEEKERGYRDFVEQYPEIRDFEREIPEAVWSRRAQNRGEEQGRKRRQRARRGRG